MNDAEECVITKAYTDTDVPVSITSTTTRLAHPSSILPYLAVCQAFVLTFLGRVISVSAYRTVQWVFGAV